MFWGLGDVLYLDMGGGLWACTNRKIHQIAHLRVLHVIVCKLLKRGIKNL